MPEIRVRKLEWDQPAAWDDALSSSATFTALDPWSKLVHQTYGYEVHRFEALQNVVVMGILVLSHIRHPVFGNYLATSPFGSYGGFSYKSLAARDTLLDEARKLSTRLGVEYCVLRFLDDNNAPPVPWIQNPIYSTYFVDLPSNAEELWGRFGSQHRKHTRQSLRKGFQIQFGHLELLDDAYEALAGSMHELGSPYHSKKYLQMMGTLLGDKLELVVVRDARGSLSGAAVLIYQDGTVTNLHANILRDFRSDYAGEFLYWSMLEHYCSKGIKVCDMGRSLNGSGNETYKMKWRPRKAPLAYWYYLPKGGHIPELNQRSAKFQLAIQVWKLLPSFVVRALGPHLIRGIV
ncbi:MAG TPA: GNAT family N-acetyltransferase [Anaerolineales bacterium]